jgi:type II secretory pathway component PulF
MNQQLRQETRAPLRKRAVVVSLLGWSSLLVFLLALPSVAKQFRELFANFGADLPRVTQLLVDAPMLFSVCLAIIALLQLVALVAYYAEHGSGFRRALWLFLGVDVLAVAAVILCFYLPILRLGAVV